MSAASKADAIAAFRAMCEGIGAQELEPDFVGSLEPLLGQLLAYVLSHPEQREVFVDGFCDLARSQLERQVRTSVEVLPYCMHTLRYPEVRAFVERRLRETISTDQWREVHVLSAYLESFDDDWSGRDLYERYGRRAP